MTISKAIFAIGVIASGTLLGGCGGGGGAGTPPLPVQGGGGGQNNQGGITSTAGVFDVNYGQFSGIYTMLDNGQFYGMHFVSGSVLAGHPRGMLSAANSVASPETIAWANFIDDRAQVGVEEGGTFGRSLSGGVLSVAIHGSMGDFGTSTDKQKTYNATSTQTLYFDALPLSTLAGNYSGLLRTANFNRPKASVGDFAITANGAFSASGADCSFAGTMVQHGTTGIFDAQGQTSGANCTWIGALKGIVTPISVNNGLPTLGFQLSSVDNIHSAVFIVSKR
jgi:hypothetical protein